MKIIVAILMIISSSVSYAHPVAYEGAFSYMTLNTSVQSENTFVYSPKYYLGAGVKHVQQGENQFTNFHLGYLVKRWNEFNSQGNFYLYGGPGKYKIQEDNGNFMRYGFQADWESRKYYTALRYTNIDASEFNQEQYIARLGFAPFIAGFNDLNAWLILQYQNTPQGEKKEVVTPVLRMFYKNVLWEIGSSFDNQWTLNFMVRWY